MPLAALILADSDESGGGEGARPALLSVAGQTVVEYQARSACAAGALHIVVMVESLPGAIVAALDRLRNEGLSVDVARDVCGAADRIHPEENLLLFASGVVADREILDELVIRGAPAVLTLAEAPTLSQHERIDGYHRWAGVALLKGEHLRATAATLGDWALGPTLLRVGIQHDATRIPVDGLGEVTIIRNNSEAREASKRLVRNCAPIPISPFERLIDPIVSYTAAAALMKPLPFDLVKLIAPFLFAAALTSGWFEMPTLGFAVFVIGLIASASAARYASAAMRSAHSVRWRLETEQGAIIILMLIASALAWRAGFGWGVNTLALWAITNLLVRPRETRWMPGPGDLAIIMLFATATQTTVIGVALCVSWQVVAPVIARVLDRF